MPSPKSEPIAEFGRRIRNRRKELGLSQEELAVRCGLHWTYVGQSERGQRNVSLVNILKLAEGLDVDAADLIRGLRVAADASSP